MNITNNEYYYLDEDTQTTMIGTVNYNGNDYDSSLYDSTVTFSNDKYFCLKSMFVAHMICNYFVFISGLICFISRILPMRYRWIHAWSGRIYILSMLWTTAASTAMTNTGLPLPTLISFAAVMGGLSIGWFAIVFHNQQTDKATKQIVNNKLLQNANNSSSDETKKQQQQSINIDDMIQEARNEVITNKTFRQRFISFKALHGIMFFVSWMQIAGRMFASNQSIEEFTCHTYPVYKPIVTREGDYSMMSTTTIANLTLVPPEDPDYYRLPWANNEVGWSLMMMGVAAVLAIVVGAIWSFVAARKARASSSKEGEKQYSSHHNVAPSEQAPVVPEQAPVLVLADEEDAIDT